MAVDAARREQISQEAVDPASGPARHSVGRIVLVSLVGLAIGAAASVAAIAFVEALV